MKKVLLVLICATAAVAAAQGPKDSNVRVIHPSQTYSSSPVVKFVQAAQSTKKDDHLKIINQTLATSEDVKRVPIAPGVGQKEYLRVVDQPPSWYQPQVFKVNHLVGTTTAGSGFEWLRVTTSDTQCIASLQADGTFVLGDGCTKSTALAWMPPASSEVYFKPGATQKQIGDAVLRVLLMMGKAQAIDYSMADALIKLAVIRARAEALPAGGER